MLVPPVSNTWLMAGGGPDESGNGAPSEELKGWRNDSVFIQAESPSKPHFHCARSAHRRNRVIAAIDWIGERKIGGSAVNKHQRGLLVTARADVSHFMIQRVG